MGLPESIGEFDSGLGILAVKSGYNASVNFWNALTLPGSRSFKRNFFDNVGFFSIKGNIISQKNKEDDVRTLCGLKNIWNLIAPFSFQNKVMGHSYYENIFDGLCQENNIKKYTLNKKHPLKKKSKGCHEVIIGSKIKDPIFMDKLYFSSSTLLSSKHHSSILDEKIDSDNKQMSISFRTIDERIQLSNALSSYLHSLDLSKDAGELDKTIKKTVKKYTNIFSSSLIGPLANHPSDSVVYLMNCFECNRKISIIKIKENLMHIIKINFENNFKLQSYLTAAGHFNRKRIKTRRLFARPPNQDIVFSMFQFMLTSELDIARRDDLLRRLRDTLDEKGWETWYTPNETFEVVLK